MNQHNPFPPQFARDYHEQRWRQLNNLIIAHGEGALTYLLAVNGGAVAGMLAFIGAVAELRHSSPALWALLIFVLGLIFAGVTRAYTLTCMKIFQKGWNEDYRSYATQQITWDELIRRDFARVKRLEWWGPWLGYSSFICFLIGLGMATFVIWNIPTK